MGKIKIDGEWFTTKVLAGGDIGFEKIKGTKKRAKKKKTRTRTKKSVTFLGFKF